MILRRRIASSRIGNRIDVPVVLNNRNELEPSIRDNRYVVGNLLLRRSRPTSYYLRTSIVVVVPATATQASCRHMKKVQYFNLASFEGIFCDVEILEALLSYSMDVIIVNVLPTFMLLITKLTKTGRRDTCLPSGCQLQ